MSDKQAAFSGVILRGLVGSTMHGTAIDGQDDRDEMAVFIEPPGAVCGLHPIDHHIQRDQPQGVRSQPGDLDLTMYSLRKFCRLAAGGNPSVQMLLWLPEYIEQTPLGRELVAIRDAFWSRSAGNAYLGYLRSQRMSLTGERSKKVARPDLVERYGYDTKYAMHALRLGYQGLEFMRTRKLTLPVPEPDLSTLRAIRGGAVHFNDAVKLIRDAEASLSAEVDSCQGEIDEHAIVRFMVDAHRRQWSDSARHKIGTPPA